MKRARITFAVIVLGVPLAWLLLAPRYAGVIEDQADVAWQQAGLPLEEFERRFPRTVENASARRLTALAAPLGIVFSSETKAAPGFPLLAELRAHTFARLEGEPATLPDSIARFRVQHAAEIEALVTHLAETEPAAWELDVTKDFEAPLPRLLPFRELADVLTIEALERNDRGSERALAAVWRLSAGLRNRPEMVSFLISVALDRQALALARRLPVVRTPIVAEVGDYDYLTAFRRSWQSEAYLMSHYAQRGGTLDTPTSSETWTTRWRYVTRPFERPLVRLCAADSSRAMAQTAIRMRALPACSRLDDAAAEQALARWNMIGRMALPSLTRALDVALAAQLDAELTRKVLALRAERAQHADWPAELSDPASQVCPGQSWRYAVAADGGISLAWGGPHPSLEKSKLTYTAPR